MVNYSNGKIYKIEPIVEHLEDEIYIGLTTKQFLSQRMDNHRRCYKSWKNGKCGKVSVYDFFNKYGVDNCKIYLLESVNANSKDEIQAKEGQYIKTLKCVNKRIECRTDKEWYNDNKVRLLEKQKEYSNNNKDKICQYQKEYRVNNKQKLSEYTKKYKVQNKDRLLEKQKQYINLNKVKLNKKCICEVCNCTYVKRNKSQHETTQKHQNNLNKEK